MKEDECRETEIKERILMMEDRIFSFEGEDGG
jgi:hypothetical protein